MTQEPIIFQPLQHVDLTEQTYQALREKILRGELRPGAQISVPSTSVALGVSRTPVNDALKRLANDGLVEIVARQGTFVTQLTSRDVAEIFEMRLMIELFAAERVLAADAVPALLAAFSGPMAEMEQALAGDSFAENERFTLNDQDLHTALVRLAGNGRLVRSYNQLHANTHGARIHYIAADNQRETQREHRAIVAAFESRDGAAVRNALEGHIMRVRNSILEVLEQRGGRL